MKKITEKELRMIDDFIDRCDDMYLCLLIGRVNDELIRRKNEIRRKS